MDKRKSGGGGCEGGFKHSDNLDFLSASPKK